MPYWFTYSDRMEYLRNLAADIYSADLTGTAEDRVRFWLEHNVTVPDWFDDHDFTTLVELVESNI